MLSARNFSNIKFDFKDLKCAGQRLRGETSSHASQSKDVRSLVCINKSIVTKRRSAKKDINKFGEPHNADNE